MITPQHLHLQLRLLFLPLVFLTLFSSCSSSLRSREARKIGITSIPSNGSSVLGTFANMNSRLPPLSAREQKRRGRLAAYANAEFYLPPQRVLLWDILRKSHVASHATDRVSIARTGPRQIRMRLLRDGRALDEVEGTFKPRGKHLHVSTVHAFDCAPLGCTFQFADLSLSSTPQGDLVTLVRYERGGFVFIGSAGDSGTRMNRFPRVE